MKVMLDDETIEYIWRNYTFYIDIESDYLKILRAKIIPLNKSDPFYEVVAKYKKETPEELQERIDELSIQKRGELAETVIIKYSDKIYMNRCRNCHKLAKTEKSERCIHCGHTWYGKNKIRSNNDNNS